MIDLIIAGATGQTGGAIVAAVKAHDNARVVAGLASRARKADDFPFVTTLEDAPDAQGVIDFSVPAQTALLAKACASKGLPFVTGTTGLSNDQQTAVLEAATAIPVVQSGNMSLGVNLLMALVEQAAAKLDTYDIELTEAHHRRKVDAPSGTALMLGEAAAKGRGQSLQTQATFAREGAAGPRRDGEIGFSVIRGGGVPGDHDVAFLAEDEVVTLSHRALNRSLFAQGALKAALWAQGKPPGLYSMQDVLGLKR
ncbi:MAG: 4-hydroxy-tetrahydrodipicolinate reductase [Pseudomonadota bacterium]